MERTGWPKVMEVDGISLLQVAHIYISYCALPLGFEIICTITASTGTVPFRKLAT